MLTAEDRKDSRSKQGEEQRVKVAFPKQRRRNLSLSAVL